MPEAQEQETVVQWCEWNRIPVFAIPNGGKRDAAEAAHMKRQGVRAGVPDLCIPLARGGYHGLVIELKRFRFSGSASTDDSVWIEIAVGAGRGKGAYIAGASDWEEFEYLLPRGTKLRILGEKVVEISPGKLGIVYRAEVM